MVGYDQVSRLWSVTDAVNNSAIYSYLANSPRVGQVGFGQSGSTRMITTKQYDDLNRLTQIISQPSSSGSLPFTYRYSYNAANQRTQNTLADGSCWTYVYDTLVNGQTTYRNGEYFRAQVPVNNTNSPLWTNILVSGGQSVTGKVFVAQEPETFQYDADGNLTNDRRWAYVWDGENRLVQMTVNTNVGPQYQLKFAYDYQGRRIQKLVATNGVGLCTNNFLYDGWNLVGVLTAGSALQNSFVWGSDLSGSMQGAGGVGGLLEASSYGSGTTNSFAAFDGNANVGGLTSAANGSVQADYEYGPFGEVIRATGPMAKVNPFRFSTKYDDDESDLLYYGHRYYKASTGNWLSRDPIQEPGFQTSHWTYLLFANSSDYQFDVNDPVDKYDYIGLKAVSACCAQWKPRWELMYGAAPASGPNKPLAKCLYNKIKELDPELYGMLIKGEVPTDLIVSTIATVTGTGGSIQDICKSGEGPGFLSRFTAALGTAWSAYSEIDKLNTIGKACDWCSQQACMKFVPKVKVDRAWYSPCRLFGSSTCLVCRQGSDEVSGEPGKPVWRDPPSP